MTDEALNARLLVIAKEFGMSVRRNRWFFERVDMERRNPSHPGDGGEDFNTAFDEFALDGRPPHRYRRVQCSIP